MFPAARPAARHSGQGCHSWRTHRSRPKQNIFKCVLAKGGRCHAHFRFFTALLCVSTHDAPVLLYTFAAFLWEVRQNNPHSLFPSFRVFVQLKLINLGQRDRYTCTQPHNAGWVLFRPSPLNSLSKPCSLSCESRICIPQSLHDGTFCGEIVADQRQQNA